MCGVADNASPGGRPWVRGGIQDGTAGSLVKRVQGAVVMRADAANLAEVQTT